LPRSIRATVHAKPGQAVIPKLGRGDPWNAVGVVDDVSLGPDAVRTLPLWKVRRSEYRPVYRRIRLNPLRTFEKRSPKAGKLVR
jgi:hypothetical protein